MAIFVVAPTSKGVPAVLAGLVYACGGILAKLLLLHTAYISMLYGVQLVARMVWHMVAFNGAF
jgi:hypothetical protein